MKEKSFLQSKAYDYIKEQILEGKLLPDTLYSEARLSKELDISRTPIREALQCLSQDGYISIVPSKGFMLRHLTEKDMQETIEVRCANEGFCTHRIAGQLTTEKGKRLLEELEGCIPAPVRQEVEAQLEMKELAGYLEKFLDSLGKRERAVFFRRYWLAQPLKEVGKACGVTEHHAAVILERSRKKLKKFLEERGIWI